MIVSKTGLQIIKSQSVNISLPSRVYYCIGECTYLFHLINIMDAHNMCSCANTHRNTCRCSPDTLFSINAIKRGANK